MLLGFLGGFNWFKSKDTITTTSLWYDLRGLWRPSSTRHPPRRGCTHSSGPGSRRCEPHRVPRVRLGPGEVDRGFWRDCVSIEGPVIDAGPQASVLGHEEEDWGCRRGRRVDKPLLKSLLDVLLHCLVLQDGQGVHSTLGECGPRQHLDCAIPWLVRW